MMVRQVKRSRTSSALRIHTRYWPQIIPADTKPPPGETPDGTQNQTKQTKPN